MSRYLIPAAVVATLSAGILAAELSEPGITLVAALVIARGATLLVQAAVWPLAAFGFGWLMWQGGKAVGERDAMQKYASAAGRVVRRPGVN